jgi:hypothetical protein
MLCSCSVSWFKEAASAHFSEIARMTRTGLVLAKRSQTVLCALATRLLGKAEGDSR